MANRLRASLGDLGNRVRAAWNAARPPTGDEFEVAVREVADTLICFVASIGTPPEWSEPEARKIALELARQNLSDGTPPDLTKIAEAREQPRPVRRRKERT